MSDQEIGSTVRRLRESRGWAQREIAEAIGGKWSQATVWSVEKGERPLRLSEAIALSAIFGVSIESLAGGESAPRSDCPNCRRVGQLLRGALGQMYADQPLV